MSGLAPVQVKKQLYPISSNVTQDRREKTGDSMQMWWWWCLKTPSSPLDDDGGVAQIPTLLPYSLTTTTEIGRGSFAIVYRGALSDGRIVALKTPRGEKKGTNGTLIGDEVKALDRIQAHPHIIEQIPVSNLDPMTDILVFEFAERDMLSHVRDYPSSQVPEVEAQCYFSQMLAAVAHCHRCHVAHRDIKLDNWLLVNGVVKLADFGLSHTFDADATHTNLRGVTGSKSYMSPEVLQGRSHKYDAFRADAWSVAVCLFAMVLGFFPYRTADRIDTRFTRNYDKCTCLTASLCRAYRVEIGISRELKDLLHNALAVRLSKRLDIGEMVKHAWVESGVAQQPRVDGSASVPVSKNELSKLTDRRRLWASFITLPILKRSTTVASEDDMQIVTTPQDPVSDQNKAPRRQGPKRLQTRGSRAGLTNRL